MRRLRQALVTLAVASTVGLTACGGSGDTATQPGRTPATATATSTTRPPSPSPVPGTPTALPTTATGPSAPPTTATTGSGGAAGTTRPTTAKPTTPATGVPARLLGRDWERIPTERRVVALTFDGGASADGVDPILATLDREGVPATFFLTGQFVKTFPAAARAIAARGHVIGSHSVTHPYFTGLADADLRAELLGAQSTIQSVTGVDPRPWFRFPYGDRDARTIGAVNALGYVPVRWTVDTLGWKGTSGGQSAQSVTDRVLAAAGSGEIVLMHVGAHPQDRSTLDAEALGGIIRELRARGYGFTTVKAM
ncbi:hypothetical protein CC117_08105 [Parafrankia colletiae]|uniref:NodB homology domain-containing protein n=1 Tax=Parafrankia colletiae TaxID=573497 RepID=A0A1S1Q6W8_9ACTN|nr:polysaccharide deacetylase family protein [Parafrankia colletiae]MCK9898938.1 polysaccharide deacetylase family protein [Frankia sp. Cpl3]OHV29319.1 hypothetical protein CC117_08105 [Parafrankia colletiae]